MYFFRPRPSHLTVKTFSSRNSIFKITMPNGLYLVYLSRNFQFTEHLCNLQLLHSHKHTHKDKYRLLCLPRTFHSAHSLQAKALCKKDGSNSRLSPHAIGRQPADSRFLRSLLGKRTRAGKGGQ